MDIVNESPEAGAAAAASGEANENEPQNQQDSSPEQGQDQGQGEPSVEQEQKTAKPVQSNVTFVRNLRFVCDLEVGFVFLFADRRHGGSWRRTTIREGVWGLRGSGRDVCEAGLVGWTRVYCEEGARFNIGHH